jgi:predicted TIM-barrel fold metal-dependent hydrolase
MSYETERDSVTKTIAVEEHCWTPALRDALVRDGRDDTVAYSAQMLDASLLDLAEERLRAMDAAGVDMQVLSTTSPGTQPLSAAEAVALARECNDVMAAAVAAHPERLAAFATLPTPDPEAAADELRRAVDDLGMVGAMVFPRTEDAYLDAARFEPILAAAAELDVPLYLHPQVPPRPVRDACFSGFSDEVELLLTTSGWGWHHDAGLAGLRLILAGTFDRHPRLQLILGHWGEMLVSFLERADMISNWAPHLERRVGEYITGNVQVSAGGIFSQRMLLSTIAAVGADRVLFATDYPFHVSSGGGARAFLDAAPISPDDRAKIGARNAERLLRLAPVAAPTASE